MTYPMVVILINTRRATLREWALIFYGTAVTPDGHKHQPPFPTLGKNLDRHISPLIRPIPAMNPLPLYPDPPKKNKNKSKSVAKPVHLPTNSSQELGIKPHVEIRRPTVSTAARLREKSTPATEVQHTAASSPLPDTTVLSPSQESPLGGGSLTILLEPMPSDTPPRVPAVFRHYPKIQSLYPMYPVSSAKIGSSSFRPADSFISSATLDLLQDDSRHRAHTRWKARTMFLSCTSDLYQVFGHEKWGCVIMSQSTFAMLRLQKHAGGCEYQHSCSVADLREQPQCSSRKLLQWPLQSNSVVGRKVTGLTVPGTLYKWNLVLHGTDTSPDGERGASRPETGVEGREKVGTKPPPSPPVDSVEHNSMLKPEWKVVQQGHARNDVQRTTTEEESSASSGCVALSRNGQECIGLLCLVVLLLARCPVKLLVRLVAFTPFSTTNNDQRAETRSAQTRLTLPRASPLFLSYCDVAHNLSMCRIENVSLLTNEALVEVDVVVLDSDPRITRNIWEKRGLNISEVPSRYTRLVWWPILSTPNQQSLSRPLQAGGAFNTCLPGVFEESSEVLTPSDWQAAGHWHSP
ncbi:hypothetical protein PR048_005932 [Dryococelus australis]|uniref:Uncharacterized protein n=1 Tax=Dryococelus australis TaxID=614101 RepID=A0ABQ9I9M7_9NEOP|nr:hypothetical protein PR048_005932 [Dryococelus australis]